MTNILYIATSVNSMIAGKDDEMGWLERAEDGDEDYGYHEFYDSLDIVAMGRRTFEISLELAGKNPYADKQVIIFSKSLGIDKYKDVEIISEIDELIKYNDKKIWIVGGGDITSKMINSGSFDKLIISILPIIIPDGIPLFKGINTKVEFDLVDSLKFESGLVQLIYTIK